MSKSSLNVLEVLLALQNNLSFHLFSSFLKTRSKTFLKVPCVSTRVSWKLRRMNRSPSQMTTTAPVAKTRARATKCLGPPSRYKSSGEQCHINLMGAHSHKFFKAVNNKNCQSHFKLPCAKFNYKIPPVAWTRGPIQLCKLCTSSAPWEAIHNDNN